MCTMGCSLTVMYLYVYLHKYCIAGTYIEPKFLCTGTEDRNICSVSGKIFESSIANFAKIWTSCTKKHNTIINIKLEGFEI